MFSQSSSSASWYQLCMHFFDKRMLAIFLLGCASGFPWVLISSAATGWLKDAGLARADIGYFGLATMFFAWNFVWAPLLDRVKLPIVHARFGQRRSWLMSCHLPLFLLTIGMSLAEPRSHFMWLFILASLMAILAATQDVAIDGYRIDIMQGDVDKLPAASAMTTIGWWTGYSLPGFVAFYFADILGWPMIYQLLSLIWLLFIGIVIMLPEPQSQRDLLQAIAASRYQRFPRWQAWLLMSFVEPLADFFRRNGVKIALLLMLFILTFKLGEAFLGRTSIQFYREIGFSNAQVAEYSKLIGWGATVVFTLLGSLLNMRFGLINGLVLGGLAMAASNLMFAWIAQVGPNTDLLLWTILLDNFTTAFSVVAFVSFLTHFTGSAFSASQYALLASIGNFGRTTLGSFGGAAVDILDGNWSLFFILTALMVLPALALLYWILVASRSQHKN